jgi:hypothetical protein
LIQFYINRERAAMKLNKLMVGLMFLSGTALSTGAWAACPGVLTVPTPTPTNSITFFDGLNYSLPILGLEVNSTPGQIQDCIVVATGSSGTQVTTNFAGMDNAYATPSGTGGPTYFRTGDASIGAADPGGALQFAGDTANTWDTQLSALSSFLDGNDMVVYFNLNQVNSGDSTNQDLFIWAQIRLVDLQDPTRTLYFYVAATPDLGGTGLLNSGTPGDATALFTGPQTDATCTYPSAGPAGAPNPGGSSPCPNGLVGSPTLITDANYMVRATGQICLNGPIGIGTPVPCPAPPGGATVNENLGANEVSSAIVFPEINAILALPGFGGYDVLQADIRYGCKDSSLGTACPPGEIQNNGFEQVFIGKLSREECVGEQCATIPEPATVALLGLGLLGAGLCRRKGRKS